MCKKAKVGKRRRFNLGSTITPLETPQEALAKSQISVAKADLAAQNSGLANMVQLTGQIAQQVGMSKGGEDTAALGAIAGVLPQFMRNGGTVEKRDVELEGGETFETPDGQVASVQGPSHTNGGVDMTLPVGTEVYSHDIKVKGVSLAKRKIRRERNLAKAQKAFDSDKSNKVFKNTLERLQQTTTNEDNDDRQLMAIISKRANGDREKFENGGPIKSLGLESIIDPINPVAPNIPLVDVPPTARQNDSNILSSVLKKAGGAADMLSDSVLGGFTGGDVLNVAGIIKSGTAGLKNTLENRAGDTPNRNFAESYGEEGLKEIDRLGQYVQGQQDLANQDIELSASAQRNRLRSSARGVNTMRSLDIASKMSADQAKRKVSSDKMSQMLGLGSRKASMLDKQDQVVATGAQMADEANRQDRDAFYSQKAVDTVGEGRMLQELAGVLNNIQQDQTGVEFMNALSDYGVEITRGSGKLKKRKRNG